MAVAIKHNSIVGYIQELKKANFTDVQAEAVAKILEQQAEIIQIQQTEIEAITSKEPATKKDLEVAKLELQKEIKNLEVKILTLYGGGFLILLGVLAKGFHWF